MIFAAPENAASGLPTIVGSEGEGGVAVRMYSKRSSDEGNGAVAGFSQVALSWRAARIACSSRSHTTARELPLLITLTNPGRLRTDDSSIPVSFAAAKGRFTFRACTMRGSFTA